jgi:hypothetical protein
MRRVGELIRIGRVLTLSRAYVLNVKCVWVRQVG